MSTHLRIVRDRSTRENMFYLKQRLSLYPWMTCNLLYRQGCPQMQMSSCKPNVGMAGVSHDAQPGPEVTLSFSLPLLTSDQHSLADAIYQK